ncbi:hypothetical protein KM043_001670 [Ampulex compressa]|nr:hypothetical protein KM043_001670 [Ampulex compressa]
MVHPGSNPVEFNDGSVRDSEPLKCSDAQSFWGRSVIEGGYPVYDRRLLLFRGKRRGPRRSSRNRRGGGGEGGGGPRDGVRVASKSGIRFLAQRGANAEPFSSVQPHRPLTPLIRPAQGRFVILELSWLVNVQEGTSPRTFPLFDRKRRSSKDDPCGSFYAPTCPEGSPRDSAIYVPSRWPPV